MYIRISVNYKYNGIEEDLIERIVIFSGRNYEIMKYYTVMNMKNHYVGLNFIERLYIIIFPFSIWRL